jgi:hypothetical protein
VDTKIGIELANSVDSLVAIGSSTAKVPGKYSIGRCVVSRLMEFLFRSKRAPAMMASRVVYSLRFDDEVRWNRERPGSLNSILDSAPKGEISR